MNYSRLQCVTSSLKSIAASSNQMPPPSKMERVTDRFPLKLQEREELLALVKQVLGARMDLPVHLLEPLAPDVMMRTRAMANGAREPRSVRVREANRVVPSCAEAPSHHLLLIEARFVSELARGFWLGTAPE